MARAVPARARASRDVPEMILRGTPDDLVGVLELVNDTKEPLLVRSLSLRDPKFADLAARGQRRLTLRQSVPEGRSLMLITQGHRYLTSELAFYLPDQPRVYNFNPDPGRIRSQYDLWETPATQLGADALLVITGEPDQMDGELANRFESIEVQKVYRHPERGKNLRVVTVALGRRLQRWPELGASSQTEILHE